MARNRCKHKTVKYLVSSVVLGIKWQWCKVCGATRLHSLKLGTRIWRMGKWVAPSIITDRDKLDEPAVRKAGWR